MNYPTKFSLMFEPSDFKNFLPFDNEGFISGEKCPLRKLLKRSFPESDISTGTWSMSIDHHIYSILDNAGTVAKLTAVAYYLTSCEEAKEAPNKGRLMVQFEKK